ncbi:hypothetical protein M407DRAFT_28274 [Tulasnella calospora MUT 4182]|uniref:Uncharacterized protein n=1 Tax=Tulasnella calospora MUT 4182 TaxID=1051891 RepID=A0A0C3Q1P8_9AGAM|nr:hypothetical protein M407DRAFT_28274 [Tulasnella calospora MUT 4182]
MQSQTFHSSVRAAIATKSTLLKIKREATAAVKDLDAMCSKELELLKNPTSQRDELRVRRSQKQIELQNVSETKERLLAEADSLFRVLGGYQGLGDIVGDGISQDDQNPGFGHGGEKDEEEVERLRGGTASPATSHHSSRLLEDFGFNLPGDSEPEIDGDQEQGPNEPTEPVFEIRGPRPQYHLTPLDEQVLDSVYQQIEIIREHYGLKTSTNYNEEIDRLGKDELNSISYLKPAFDGIVARLETVPIRKKKPEQSSYKFRGSLSANEATDEYDGYKSMVEVLRGGAALLGYIHHDGANTTDTTRASRLGKELGSASKILKDMKAAYRPRLPRSDRPERSDKTDKGGADDGERGAPDPDDDNANDIEIGAAGPSSERRSGR